MNKAEAYLSGRGVISISRNAIYMLGGRGINITVRFVYAIVLATYFGPRLYGLLNYGISWYLAFLPLTGLGLGMILSREIGRDRTEGARFVATTFTLRIVVAFFAAMVCGFVGWFSEWGLEARKLLLFFSAALIGRSVAIWAQQVFTAYEANKYSFQLQAIFRPLEVVFGLAFVFIRAGIIAIAAVHALSWWLQAFCGMVLIRRYMVKVRLDCAWSSMKRILAQSLPVGVGVIMVNWLLHGPLVLFRHIAGNDNSLGQLALSMQAFMVLSNLPIATSSAALPVLSRTVERRDGKDLLFVEIILRSTFIVGAAGGLLGLIAGPGLVNSVFGTRFSMAGHLLGPVLWLLIPWTIGNALWRVYLARGHFFIPTVFTGVGALVLTFCMPWLVALMDTPGAVVAAGAGISVWAFGLVLMLERSGEIITGRVVFRPLATALAALGVYFLLRHLSIWIVLPASFLTLLGGVLAFGVFSTAEFSALVSTMRMIFPFSAPRQADNFKNKRGFQ